jgi:hypothetical protein
VVLNGSGEKSIKDSARWVDQGISKKFTSMGWFMNPMNEPEFVRVREAWYKAGAGAMAGYSAFGVLIVGLAVGVTSFFHRMEPYETAMSVVFGGWTVIAVMNCYTDISARDIARKGGVQVDPF